MFDRAVDKPGRGIIIQVVNNIIVRFLLIFCSNMKDKRAFFLLQFLFRQLVILFFMEIG